MIKGLNRQFRQITKSKPSFTNDDSLRRMLYLASQQIVKHWHTRRQNWDMVLSQLVIMFADRAVGCPRPPGPLLRKGFTPQSTLFSQRYP